MDAHFEKPLMVTTLLLSIGLITYQVLFRYIATDLLGITGSTAEVEELAIWCFIWASYLSIPVLTRTRSNIRITILTDCMPKRVQDMLWGLDEFVFLVIITVLAVLCFNLSSMQFSKPNYSPAMGIN